MKKRRNASFYYKWLKMVEGKKESEEEKCPNIC
jgi:hypothetical protein